MNTSLLDTVCTVGGSSAFSGLHAFTSTHVKTGSRKGIGTLL